MKVIVYPEYGDSIAAVGTAAEHIKAGLSDYPGRYKVDIQCLKQPWLPPSTPSSGCVAS